MSENWLNKGKQFSAGYAYDNNNFALRMRIATAECMNALHSDNVS